MIVIKGTYRLQTLAIALALTSCAHAQSASAPAKIIFEKLGFTVENVIAKVKEL